MGQEIDHSHFHKQDFEKYGQRLRQETALLEQWFTNGYFVSEGSIGGFELEAWLLDQTHAPAPINETYLERLGDENVSPELARFNVEFNTQPRPLHGKVLSLMRQELHDTWHHAALIAAECGTQLGMIGILPTVREAELCMDNMSQMKRYRALNEQVLRLRHGKPLTLDIQGRDRLHTEHQDVMLESAATSFQIHLQVDPGHAVRFYNTAKILSAPMVAICANSPYLFGYDLWDETRIPLFEQAVAVTDKSLGEPSNLPRVTFGSGYLKDSMFECFRQNIEEYAVLLPILMDSDTKQLSHVRLHNGTIWRWNRPLIGFDSVSGRPHLRIEHRVIPSGPTIIDTIANAALFYGLIHALGGDPDHAASGMSFARAKGNFYTAAKYGLDAQLYWQGGQAITASELFSTLLLAQARHGLEGLGIDRDDISDYLGVIEARLKTGQNGARWQRAYVAAHGHNMTALTAAYLERQQQGQPVAEWTV